MTFDYVEWVEWVTRAILAAWNAADEDTRYIGVEPRGVADALGLSVETRAPDFENMKLVSVVTLGAVFQRMAR